MIVATVILSILNQIEFRLVLNRKENCHHDHFPFNLKVNGNLVFSVYIAVMSEGFQGSPELKARPSH